MRLARGFLNTAALPFEERYRSYMEVFDDEAVAALLCVPPVTEYNALASAFESATGTDEANRMMAVDAETQLPDDLLLLTDRMSMAVSLECRVPLLDHELVELAARIPERMKMRDGRLKHVMKEALADVLPKDILDRRKRGFGAPMGAWLKQGLKPLLHSVLSRDAVERRGLFRPAAIAALIADHEASRIDGTDRLLALLNFEIWARIFLDDRPAEEVTDELRAATA
jgi:asparagine synthase (glutamine-hydrolysing)